MQEFWRFVTHDWYFAIPMFCMSLVAVGLVIWRILLNVNVNTNLNQFLPAFQEKLAREGVAGAINYCKEQKGLIPRRLFVAGLETSRQGLAASRRAMAHVLELEIVPQLNFLLPTILAIAKIATMVGLLGTVISMIDTFTKIQGAEGGDAKSHAGAIGLAQGATAAYTSYILGQGAKIYLQQGCQWGTKGIKTVIQQILDRAQADSVMERLKV